MSGPAKTPYEQLLEDLLVERQRPVPPPPSIYRAASAAGVVAVPSTSGRIAAAELHELLEEMGPSDEPAELDRRLARSAREGRQRRAQAAARISVRALTEEEASH